jgi:hypothetical protein
MYLFEVFLIYFIAYFQALSKDQDTFRKQQKSGIHHEDTFLQETATREESYKTSINELEPLSLIHMWLESLSGAL